MEEMPYSYHTFLYPFSYSKKGRVSMRKFEVLLSNNAWEKEEEHRKQYSEKDKRLDYATIQYFNDSAEDALLNDNANIVHNYVYRQNYLRNHNVWYIIRTHEECNREFCCFEYHLKLNAVRLKIFNTGVAIICYECEYYPCTTNKKQCRNDVKRINEYGRRVYPEIIPENKETGFMLCADSLEILGLPIEVKDDFRQNVINGIYLENPKSVRNPNIIHRLLRDGAETADFEVEPTVDSRMFVCCCIRDQEYVESLIGYRVFDVLARKHQQADWKFMTDWEAGQELYAVTNIDPGSGSSCQNRKMLDMYFEQQLYLRWIEYGTIHAVTNHSMVCLTSESPKVESSVVNPFLTMYVQMCILVLAQRTSLIEFDKQITHIITKDYKIVKIVKKFQKKLKRRFKNKPNRIEKKQLRDLIRLEERYSVFQGQLLIPEPTPQIQGIELYAKLQDMLFIDKLQTDIQQQASNLFEIAEANRGDTFNYWAAAFAIMSIVLAVMQSSEDFCGFIKALISCIAFGVVAYLYRAYRKKH